MNTKTIKLEHPGQPSYELIIKQATVLAGTTRSRLRNAGIEADEQDPDRRALRIITYPDLIAATEPVTGFDAWPPDFESFLSLPEKLVIDWETFVYELNPHWSWLPSPEEKKANPTNSTNE